MDEVEHAVSCFEDGFSCSQAVLSAYGEQFGMGREMALKVSGAFGGGMGHLGETGGAVTGAFMLYGSSMGRREQRMSREGRKLTALSRNSLENLSLVMDRLRAENCSAVI